MSKGAVIAAVVVGGVVLIGGAALALAAPKPVIRPNLAPPPPPPPPLSLGGAIITQGLDLYDKANKNPVVNAYTGGESSAQYARDYAINPYVPLAKAGVKLASKAWHAIF